MADIDLENMELEDFDPEDVMAARQKLLEMLDSENIGEAEKEQLRALLSGNMPLFAAYGGWSGVLLALGLALIVFSIIFFFGYKLYKSIKDKELKKEEKKKAKQMKKKK
ncbi:uncharacterized protein LOC135084947 isoform X2 [Ostrinia nubilalis]|uniref:uncharacterized protein LOC135084947 isoform X2 n=1 Tax=Ostrinia nubilalis TaxID=29057 RepID=UPI0030826A56